MADYVKGFDTQDGVKKYDYGALANIPPDEVYIGLTQPEDTSKLWVDTDDTPEQDPYIKKSEIVNLVYPVGSLYFSMSDVDPANFIGGTWTRVEDRFVLAAGDVYSAGTTGGESSHVLTIDEMPSHSHSILLNSASSASYDTWDYSFGASKANRNYYSQSPAAPIVGNTGGSVAHNNMPPYLAVFVWRRTA